MPKTMFFKYQYKSIGFDEYESIYYIGWLYVIIKGTVIRNKCDHKINVSSFLDTWILECMSSLGNDGTMVLGYEA